MCTPLRAPPLGLLAPCDTSPRLLGFLTLVALDAREQPFKLLAVAAADAEEHKLQDAALVRRELRTLTRTLARTLTRTLARTLTRTPARTLARTLTRTLTP